MKILKEEQNINGMTGFHILKMLRCTLRTGFLNKIIVRKQTDLSKRAQGNLHDSSKEKPRLWNTVFLSGLNFSVLNFAGCIFLSVALPITPSPISGSISKNSVHKRARVSFKV